jgi:hypothetical protein
MGCDLEEKSRALRVRKIVLKFERREGRPTISDILEFVDIGTSEPSHERKGKSGFLAESPEYLGTPGRVSQAVKDFGSNCGTECSHIFIELLVGSERSVLPRELAKCQFDHDTARAHTQLHDLRLPKLPAATGLIEVDETEKCFVAVIVPTVVD